MHIGSQDSRVTLRVRAAAVFVLLLLGVIPSRCAENALPVHIGKAVVVLTGYWKFHPGDDPAWGQPDFDDSNWPSLNLTPPPGSIDPITGATGYVPGWTSQGYPNLTHYAWYRIHLNVDNEDAKDGSLALILPLNFDDAYQIFVNGVLIGQYGEFTSHHVVIFNAQPRAFALPKAMESGPVTIAIRMWMDAGTPLITTDAGGLHGPPMLGQASSIDAMLRLEWDRVNRAQLGNLISTSLMLLAALFGLTLFQLDRREPTYLWLALACLAVSLGRLSVLLGYYTMIEPIIPETFLQDVCLQPLSLALWAMFWASWFRIGNIGRVARIALSLACAQAITIALVRPPLYGGLIPVSASGWLVPLSLLLKLALGALLVWVTVKGIRKGLTSGWLALAPILLTVILAYWEELSVMHFPIVFLVGGLTFSMSAVAGIFMVVIISVLLMQRFIQGQREREQWRLEIEQARQVQQVLIPETLPSVPGFALASEYRPAQQVGGDFFQLIPLAGGGVLAVIGDVSGKGMPAAMTVSLLVGTLRTLAEFTTSPGQILSAINQRMISRTKGGFTTCLVLRVEPDGRCVLANAGHLAPYVDGKELPVEGGLPLGLSADAVYPEAEFRLAVGQQITLLTDGVVEARAANGELLGFARTAAMSTESAEAIAHAAQSFGHQDDITVLTVKRLAVGEEAAIRVATSVLAPELA